MAGRTRRPLVKTPTYWDSSALVPLCTNQKITPKVRRLEATVDIVTWWATPVEMDSAFARLSRLNQLDIAELANAKKIATLLANSWWLVLPSESIRNAASSFVYRYALRAADALQLSAALDWCENTPAGRIFITADDRLRDAAQAAGFDVSHL